MKNNNKVLLSLLMVVMTAGSCSLFASQTSTTSAITAELAQEDKDAKDVKSSNAQSNDDDDVWLCVRHNLQKAITKKSDLMLAAEKSVDAITSKYEDFANMSEDDFKKLVSLYEQLANESKNDQEVLYALYELFSLYGEVGCGSERKPRDPKIALEYAERMLKVAGNNHLVLQVEMLDMMAGVYAGLDNDQARISCLERAASVPVKERWHAVLQLVDLYKRAHTLEAQQKALLFLQSEADSGQPEVLRALAFEYMYGSFRNLDKALEIWRMILQHNPDHALSAYYEMGNVYKLMGNRDRAIEIYKELVNQNVDSYVQEQATWGLAAHYFEKDDYAQARPLYEMLTRSKNAMTVKHAWLMLMRVCGAMGKIIRAVECYEQTKRLFEGDEYQPLLDLEMFEHAERRREIQAQQPAAALTSVAVQTEQDNDADVQ